MPTAELDVWFYQPDPAKFPYDAVVREFHSVGKHFMLPATLESLVRVRELLPGLNSPWPGVQTLANFLDTALDKPDGRYDYPTYLALPLLQMPSVDDPAEQSLFTRSRCDRLIVQLATDALNFELEAADGQTTLLPDMRPTPEIRAKRYRLGMRAIRPALARLALDRPITASEPEQASRQACAVVRSDMSLLERRVLQLTMLPVHTLHDEFMFLRVLQLFETSFALQAVHLRATVAALAGDDTGQAVYFLTGAEQALREVAPLFSMLATMQIESFRTFRDFTEGASAIQSRNYKIVESLCRVPDRERMDSASYLSVPEVREQVLDGRLTLDDAFRAARDSEALAGPDREALEAAMGSFAGTLMRWRTTHHRLAARMLGDSKGSGYTEGVPYLAACRSIPVFLAVGAQQDGEAVNA